MRRYAVIAILTFAPGLWPAGNKLTWEDRVELTRGLTAEYATVKALLPRSSRALVFDAAGGYDKNHHFMHEQPHQAGLSTSVYYLSRAPERSIGTGQVVSRGRPLYRPYQAAQGAFFHALPVTLR